MSEFTAKDVRRFWSKVDKSGGEDVCWLWKASCTPQGYGHFPLGRKIVIASRFSWELAFGEIPVKLHVLHHCDTPSCVNPKHLFLGTNLDNVRDSLNKKRRSPRKGEANGRAKLCAEDVELIRNLYAYGINQDGLAEVFGVSAGQISHIVNNRAWRHTCAS